MENSEVINTGKLLPRLYLLIYINLSYWVSLYIQQADVLLKKKHPESDDVKQCTQRLTSKWNELLQASNNRGKGLVELKDILKFNEQVSKVEMWIREKVRLCWYIKWKVDFMLDGVLILY